MNEHFTYKKLIKYVIPSICMMIFTSIYNIVDGLFLTNFAGKNQFAGVNLIMPVIMILGAFGFMIGSGGAALVSYTMGAGDEKKAREIFTMLVVSIAVVGYTIAGIGFIFMPQIADLLGATPLIRESCIVYGRTSLISLAAFMLMNAYQNFLITAGKGKLGFITSVVSGCMNMVLDYVLVYYFRLGVLGAASATVVTEYTGAIVPTIFFLFNKDWTLRFTKFKLADFKHLIKACKNGISEMLSNISAPIVSMIYNFQLMRFAGENGLAAYGVVMYVSFVFQAIFFGFSMGINPLVGYNYGAENKKELSSILKKSTVIVAVIGSAMLLASEVFADEIGRAFVGYDAEVCTLLVNGFRIYSVAFIMSGFNIAASAFFTGLGNGLISGVISFSRTFVIQVLALLILPIFFEISGVWAAIGVAEFVTLILSVTMVIISRKKYEYSFG